MTIQRILAISSGTFTELVPATSSAGTSSAGEVVALNAGGLIDPTMQISGLVVITDASPIAINFNGAAFWIGAVTLSHTTTTRALNVSGMVAGGNYTLTIMQDSTGGASLTLGTGATWKVVGGGAGAITLTSTANGLDVLAWTYDGTNCLATIGNNYS